MEPTNPNTPANNPVAPQNPAIAQPLNTSGVPADMGLPTQMSGSPQVTQPSGGGKKMMMIIIIILVLAILGVGGYYFYMQYSKKSSQPAQETTQSAQDLTDLQTEADSIEVTDPAGDLMEVDKEINLLDATPSAIGDR